MLNYSEVNLILFCDGKPIGVFEADYIGVLGIHLINSRKIAIQKNSNFEMEVEKEWYSDTKCERIPVIVSPSADGGLSIMLKHYDCEHINSWLSIMNRLLTINMDLNSFNVTEKVSALN